MMHAILGPFLKGPTEPTVVQSLKQAQELFGRLDTVSSSAPELVSLAAVANATMNGLQRILVVRSSQNPTLEALKALVLKVRDVAVSLRSIAIPHMTDPQVAMRLASWVASLSWSSDSAQGPSSVPLLWFDLPEELSPDLAQSLRIYPESPLVPVFPPLLAQPPGHLRLVRMPASTLAVAGFACLGQPLRGTHQVARTGVGSHRSFWRERGAVTFARYESRRPALTMVAPQLRALAKAQASHVPMSKVSRDPLTRALQEILDEERFRGGPNPAKSAARRMSMHLHRVWQSGKLVGARPEEAFRVEAEGEDTVRVFVQRPKRVLEVKLMFRGDMK